MKKMIKCWFDGACGWENPGGYMGIGAIVQYNGYCDYRYDGFGKDICNSNNRAEYRAFILLLGMLDGLKGEYIVIYGDSNLVVKQMNGEWKIKRGYYTEDALKAKKVLERLRKNNCVELRWIPREENSDADELSNEGIRLFDSRYYDRWHSCLPSGRERGC